MLLASSGVIATIFALRIFLSKRRDMTINGVAFAGIIASILNALQIQVFNLIYGDLAIALNNYENHRTDTEYEDALIAKTFIFQFVNSFASLFYIGFIKPFIPKIDRCVGSCMAELQTSLGTIFLIQLTVGNITAVAVPAITRRMADKKLQDFDEVSEVEHASLRSNYDVMLGTFFDYNVLIIQYGYATMFICAFPLAVTNALINNYVAIRLNAWKLCQAFIHPTPRYIA